MRIVLQRVKNARVEVKEKNVGEISRGFLLFLAVHKDDNEQDANWLIDKILQLKLFEDKVGSSFLKQNIKDINGEILVVSQFTLYGNCKKGSKPDFGESADFQKAESLYKYFVQKIEKEIKIEKGVFGEQMNVVLENDGPITLIIDSKK